ncbi:MAG: carboxypeptidase-like regulatory domain-containing protein [Armatimonadota bacterium]
MARGATEQPSGSTVPLLLSSLVGLVSLFVSLLLYRALLGSQGTEAARLARVGSYMMWSQPLVYLIAGLIAAGRDPRWGPVRAPVIGLFLASCLWLLLRRQGLLPPDPTIIGYLFTAGALFSLFGALVAPPLGDRVGSAVIFLFLLGLTLFVWAYLNLGSISGQVTREVIQRAQGVTTAMTTTPVQAVRVALLDAQQEQVLYEAKTTSSGHYLISHVPIGSYRLRVWDPLTPAVITQPVQVERSITGGTRWQAVALPSTVRDSGRLFD